LLIADHVMPLYRPDDELWTATSMDRGSMGAELRATVNRAKRWRRDGRARGRVAQKMDGGRPRSGPDADE
jgi:hypothetical protein